MRTLDVICAHMHMSHNDMIWRNGALGPRRFEEETYLSVQLTNSYQ